MKVLWFSNCCLSQSESSGSGSWLFAMRHLLSDSVNLYNISDSNVDAVKKIQTDSFCEYIIPKFKLSHGIPSDEDISKVNNIIQEVNPDIIHIWGLEKYWALLFSTGKLKGNTLLEVQGIKTSCSTVFWGGLSILELIRCVSIRDLLLPRSSLVGEYIDYYKSRKKEKNILSRFKNISVQSKWTKNQVSIISGVKQDLYVTKRPIRAEFYSSMKWKKPTHRDCVIFTSLSYYTPFKGLHILLYALSQLKNDFPEIKLRIAGPNVLDTKFYKRGGYDNFICFLIRKLKIEANVVFVGKLTAAQIVDNLLESDVFVNPSFVESYSASSAEALYLGVPCVLSYAGAMPEFSENQKITSYYSPNDYISCAAEIKKILEDESGNKTISKLSSQIMYEKCGADQVKRVQLEIYNSVLKR